MFAPCVEIIGYIQQTKLLKNPYTFIIAYKDFDFNRTIYILCYVKVEIARHNLCISNKKPIKSTNVKEPSESLDMNFFHKARGR